MTQKQLNVVGIIVLVAGLFLFIMKQTESDPAEKSNVVYKADNLPDSIYMPEDKFWSLIERSSSSDYEKQQETLSQLLSTEDPAEIIKFENRFHHLQDRAYDWKLWAAAYIINGGCSDDCFIDFRSWLIGQGRDTYEMVLDNPEALTEIKIEPDHWEGIQYVAMTVYKKKTNQEIPINKLPIKKEPSGKEWQEEELSRLLPKLSEKYNQ